MHTPCVHHAYTMRVHAHARCSAGWTTRRPTLRSSPVSPAAAPPQPRRSPAAALPQPCRSPVASPPQPRCISAVAKAVATAAALAAAVASAAAAAVAAAFPRIHCVHTTVPTGKIKRGLTLTLPLTGKINEDYRVNWIVDNLPAATRVVRARLRARLLAACSPAAHCSLPTAHCPLPTATPSTALLCPPLPPAPAPLHLGAGRAGDADLLLAHHHHLRARLPPGLQGLGRHPRHTGNLSPNSIPNVTLTPPITLP